MVCIAGTAVSAFGDFRQIPVHGGSDPKACHKATAVWPCFLRVFVEEGNTDSSAFSWVRPGVGSSICSHRPDLVRSHSCPGLSSAEGTALNQPRVERHEWNECRATLGTTESCLTRKPRRGGPNCLGKRDALGGGPVGAIALCGRLPRVAQRLAELAFAPPWAD